MSADRISQALSQVYLDRDPSAIGTEHGDAMCAEWSVPLHRCHRRLSRLRELLPEHHDMLVKIWRDLDLAINATRPLVKQLGIDTSSPLRRKPGASQPQPIQPELPAVEASAQVLAGTPANPIRANIARALNRLAAAIAPAAAPCSPLPASSPVAPHNETPKGPNT